MLYLIAADLRRLNMGSAYSRILCFGRKRQILLLMVGLDAAGKTTILYKLKQHENVTKGSTIGFNVETIERDNISFSIWDGGHQDVIKQLWRRHYHKAKGLIFVVDSSDHDRIEEAADELQQMLREDELRDAVVLILANKMDSNQAMPVQDICDKLGLNRLKGRTWYIQTTCAIDGTGLCEGLRWLSDQFSKK